MKTFEDLQYIWSQQSESKVKPTVADTIKKAEEHTKKIKSNHFWTKIILTLTALILISYYIWVGAFRQTFFSLGLGIMITMLFLRIVLEWISAQKLKNLKTDVALIQYSKNASEFYIWRKKIHYVFTPIIYLVYIAGFTSLLGVFRENFSRGFYLYIVFSGYGFLLLFGFFMFRIIKKEIQLLNFLKNIS